MGYGQRATGRIEITPPLKMPEMRAHPALMTDDVEAARLERGAYVLQHIEITPTDEGEISLIRGIAIVLPSPDEEFSRYTVLEDVQRIVDAFPGHSYTGAIFLTGEDGGMSAIRIRAGVAEEIQPKIVWPDGLEFSE